MSTTPEFKHLSLIEITDDHLDAIMAIEQVAYEVPWTRGHFIDCLKSDYLMQIIRDDAHEETIGYWVLQIILDELHILNFCVNPSCQGNGYGKQMMESLKQFCSRTGINRILLEVRKNNKVARNLYRATGFEHVGTRKGYYPGVDGNRVDAIIMEQLISSDEVESE